MITYRSDRTGTGPDHTYGCLHRKKETACDVELTFTKYFA